MEALVERRPRGLLEIGLPVHRPGHPFPRPVEGEDVESVDVRQRRLAGPVAGGRQRAAVVQSAVHLVAAAPAADTEVDGLGDVDLARQRVGPVVVVLGQHPDGGPHPLSRWQLRPHLDAAIQERRLAAGGDARRGVGLGPAPSATQPCRQRGPGHPLAPGSDPQQAVGHRDVFGPVRVALAFVVAAAPAVHVGGPFGRVQPGPLELVRPDQAGLGRGHRGGGDDPDHGAVRRESSCAIVTANSRAPCPPDRQRDRPGGGFRRRPSA